MEGKKEEQNEEENKKIPVDPPASSPRHLP